MYTQVSIAALLLVGCSLAYPRTYQEQRQIYYTQPIPVHQRLAAAPQLYLQQQPLLQVPAATSLLPNNVNNGVRYGQHQVVYVVPSGSQVYFEEGAGEGGSGSESGIVDSLYNFFNGIPSYFFGPQKPAEGGGGATGGAEENPEKTQENPEKAEKPEKLEQSSATENLIVGTEQLQQGVQTQQLLQQPLQQQLLQQQPLQQQPLQQQPLQQQPLQQLPLQQQPLQQQPLQQQSLQPQPLQLQSQKLQNQLFHQQQQQSLEKYLALRNQFVANNPALSLPSSNLLYYKNVPQVSDYNSKPGAAAIAFQRYLSNKAHENHGHQTTTEKEENENEESASEGEQSTNEELGPSIAQAKPHAVSVAGPGGVAAAAPVGTAIVGPGGMALSAPQATAVAGTKTKPASNEKLRTFFPKNSAAAAFYPY